MPVSGPLPWISGMGVIGTTGAVHGSLSTTKDTVRSVARLSGGSTASWSVTDAALITKVHWSPLTKSEVGSSTKVVGPPETSAVLDPVSKQSRAYHPSA